jgi:hypothetical protein
MLKRNALFRNLVDHDTMIGMKKTILCFLMSMTIASLCQGAEKTIMHCFAFTPRPEATDADFKAYYEATDQLAKDFTGIKRVWYGKLRAPLNQVSVDPASAKKFTPESPKVEGATATRVRREHGACMEFVDAAAWGAYAKSPAHDAWAKVYDKVRVPGTTTYQILPVQ